VLFGVGAFPLAGDLHHRLLGARGVHPVHVLTAVMAAVCAWGFTLFTPAELFGAPAWAWVAAVPVGLALGVAATRLDRAVLRRSRRRSRRAGAQRGSSAGPPLDPRAFPLWGDVSVGALEELIYRGFLVQAALLLAAPYAAPVLAATAAAYALSHIWFGWRHVAAKLPLSLLALGSTLALGTVLPALVAHVYFNARVWSDIHDRTALIPVRRSHAA
jgi:Type II CAAX prenyl endopeptidase Rce1-like